MKKVVRVLAFILAVCLSTCVLVSCGKDNTKVSSDTLEIGIINRGYGTEFLDSLVTAFSKKTGKKAKVVRRTTDNSWVNTSLFSGSKANTVDLYFSIQSNFVGLFKSAAAYAGLGDSEKVLADLSDVYDAPLEGYSEEYNVPLKQVMGDYNLKSSMFEGKNYVIPWATGMEGLIYNKALFNKYNLSIPRTTDEMFELFEQIKTLGANGGYAKNDKGHNIYPYTYSGKVGYGMYLTTPWWIQYSGDEVYQAFSEGKDLSGNYTADIFLDKGRLKALEMYSEILNVENAQMNAAGVAGNGYVNPNCNSLDFTVAQMSFFAQESFFISTGDWVEREMEAFVVPGSVEIAFMPIPIISSVIDSDSAMPDHSIKTETDLRTTIDYVNGKTATKPSGVTDNDIEYIRYCTNLYMTESVDHMMIVPSYSNNIELAKEFIRFILSKQGQEIMLKVGKGNMVPLQIPISEFDVNLSAFQKSKYEIMKNVNFCGRTGNSPMSYTSGVVIWYGASRLDIFDTAFGCANTLSNYMTAEEYQIKEYETYAEAWTRYMQNAGVHN